jgi:5-methylcytosine-specific restriction endonuclease McrA
MGFNDALINAVYDMTDGYCYYCGKRLSYHNYGRVGAKGAWEIDYFIPYSRNGAHQLRNFVPACVNCNTTKSDMMPWEFSPYEFPYGERSPDTC